MVPSYLGTSLCQRRAIFFLHASTYGTTRERPKYSTLCATSDASSRWPKSCQAYVRTRVTDTLSLSSVTNALLPSLWYASKKKRPIPRTSLANFKKKVQFLAQVSLSRERDTLTKCFFALQLQGQNSCPLPNPFQQSITVMSSTRLPLPIELRYLEGGEFI